MLVLSPSQFCHCQAPPHCACVGSSSVIALGILFATDGAAATISLTPARAMATHVSMGSSSSVTALHFLHMRAECLYNNLALGHLDVCLLIALVLGFVMDPQRPSHHRRHIREWFQDLVASS